jgi:hypothetical protein
MISCAVADLKKINDKEVTALFSLMIRCAVADFKKN